MNAHPILFSAPMVRAIFDGSKTQTRRVVKPQPSGSWRLETANGDKLVLGMITSPHPKKGRFGVFLRHEMHPGSGRYMHDLIPCPYGQPGDLLWVRETFSAYGDFAKYRAGRVTYHADTESQPQGLPWKPSIHMPRWASRLTLEITDVRVERIESISEGDAIREGMERRLGMMPEYRGSPDLPWRQEFPRDAFRELWDSINAKRGYGWDVNPWVWALTFKAHQMNVDAMLRVAA